MTRLLKVQPNTVGRPIVARETELFDSNPEQARKHFERAIEASYGTCVYAPVRLGDLLCRIGDREQAGEHVVYVEKESRTRLDLGDAAWFSRGAWH